MQHEVLVGSEMRPNLTSTAEALLLPAIPLQRAASAGPRLQSQTDSGTAPLQPQLRRLQKFASLSPNDVELQEAAAMALQQSPGASSLSTPQSSQLSRGSSPWSCTTRSSTPTSILNPPTTEKKHRTPPFNVYDAQPQNFKNPLFGTRASPSPQLAGAAYTGKHIAASDRTDLGRLDCDADTAADPDSGHHIKTTAVANLSQEIDAVAGCKPALHPASPDQH